MINLDLFAQALVSLGLPIPQEEYRFCPTRRWRVDYCWPDHKLAVEIEGGAWRGRPCPACGNRGGGRHNRGGGFLRDKEKYNALTMAGYSLLRFTPQDFKTGVIYTALKEWFDKHGR